MRKEVLICDICGTTLDVETVGLFEKRYSDASGSMDDSEIRVELCGNCARRMLAETIASAYREVVHSDLLEHITDACEKNLK